METQKPIYECRYEPQVFIQYLWMVWGISGFIFLYLDPGNGPLEIFFLGLYAVIIITSVMAYFNRENGFNHRIQFYSDHMVVPKAMMLFHWQEQVIFYRDVDKVSFGPIFHPKYGIPMEINLHIGGNFYRIFGSKLTLEGMQGLMMALKQKVGYDESEFSPSQMTNPETQPELVTAKSAEENETPEVPEAAMAWRNRIRWMVVICFIWWTCAFFASTRGQFYNLVDPSPLLMLGFVLSMLIAVMLLYYIPWQKARIHTLQKFFFLGFVFVYGGLGFFQSLITLNGYFDKSQGQLAERKIESEVEGNKGAASCFYLERHPGDRLPASEPNGPIQQIRVCNPVGPNSEGPNFKVGDSVKVQINEGAFGVQWVKQIQKVSN